MKWPLALLAGVSFGLSLFGVMNTDWPLWGLGWAGMVASGLGQWVIER